MNKLFIQSQCINLQSLCFEKMEVPLISDCLHGSAKLVNFSQSDHVSKN